MGTSLKINRVLKTPYGHEFLCEIISVLKNVVIEGLRTSRVCRVLPCFSPYSSQLIDFRLHNQEKTH